MELRIGDMAQLVERRVRNAKVRGSNPLISTMKISCILYDIFLFIAFSDKKTSPSDESRDYIFGDIRIGFYTCIVASGNQYLNCSVK